jgi:hypothetical protein
MEARVTDKLVATIEQRRSGARLIKLAGVLDEDNDLSDLGEKVGAGKALINLAGVERINDQGRADWMAWLASLEAKGIRPIFIACSPAVVAELNLNSKFVGNGEVKSFHVPYHCPTCSIEKLLLVHIIEMGPRPHTAPPCACDGCGEQMFFSEEDSYFAFVHQLQSVAPPKPVESAELARGSNSSVTAEQLARVSQPRLPPRRSSRPSLSAFQLGEGKRPSEAELLLPRSMPPSERPYMILVIMLLLATVGILVYLLLVR